jgi:hypothetical protein
METLAVSLAVETGLSKEEVSQIIANLAISTPSDLTELHEKDFIKVVPCCVSSRPLHPALSLFPSLLCRDFALRKLSCAARMIRRPRPPFPHHPGDVIRAIRRLEASPSLPGS